MHVLYLIPARGGSKGLPRKNILPLGGVPLVVHSIKAAQASACQGRIIVSTDDPEIAAVAKEAGAEVPFMRPAELATDAASTLDVILHALDWCSDHEIALDVLVLLQPTSPLRTGQDIDAALRLLSEKKAGAIVSVCETEHHPMWCNTLPADHSMKGFLKDEIKGLSRQQLPLYYRVNGAIYLSKIPVLQKHKSFLHDSAYAYIMPAERSIDIDHEIDFRLAELLIQNNP